MLFKPEAFEPLTETQWDAARARHGIRRTVADVDATFDVEKLWPADEWDGWQAATPMKNLYVGAAGVIHVLDVLRGRGIAETQIDLAAAGSAQALEAFRSAPDYIAGEKLPATPEAGLLTGETGILVVAWSLSPSDDLDEALLARVRQNVDNTVDELMWAARERSSSRARCSSGPAAGPGRQRARPTRLRRPGSARAPSGGHLRASRAYCRRRRRARKLADARRRRPPRRRGDPRAVVRGSSGDRRLRRLVPRRRASRRGSGARLANRSARYEQRPVYLPRHRGQRLRVPQDVRRTGDERWPERARRFAVHALEQVERRGHGRYSLWTGDLGVALYAADCRDVRAAYPVLETWN